MPASKRLKKDIQDMEKEVMKIGEDIKQLNKKRKRMMTMMRKMLNKKK
jgi:hypothetical protein